MSKHRVLFIGGTGCISQAVTALAAERGFDLTLLNRGRTDRPVPRGVKVIRADVRDPRSYRRAVAGKSFDTVVDWIAFTPEHVQADLDLFRGRIGQYLFISSASVYQKPLTHWLITESTPLKNPYWDYSRNKIACEELLNAAYRREDFPATIVRPTYTYYTGMIPTGIGGHDYTVTHRLRTGKPLILHGDGTSLWTMTHNTDFARGFVGLLGNAAAVGNAFHITSDEALTWRQIYETIAEAAGVRDPRFVCVPSERIARIDAGIGAGLLGDKSWSVVFDNTKIKRFVPGFQAVVPFAEGVRRSMAVFDSHRKFRTVNPKMDALMDRILAEWDKR